MITKYAIYKNELYENIGTDTIPHLVTFNDLIAKAPKRHNIDTGELIVDVNKTQIVTWFLVKYSSTIALGVAILAIIVK